jgi:F-type H+-transporting ATPase subunit gamma
MAKARAIVKRRKAVRNIRKITKTMQMIATAKFQKSLKRAVGTKPYTLKIRELVKEVALSAGDIEHPLLGRRAEPARRVAVVVICSNRGLCGAYNGNVLRMAAAFLRRQEAAGNAVDLHICGKKAATYFTFQKRPIAARHEVGDIPRYADVERLATKLMDQYTAGEIDAVHIAHMNFLSTSTQRPEVLTVLPMAGVQEVVEHIGKQAAERDAQHEAGIANELHKGEAIAAPEHAHGEVIYDFSPAPRELLDYLLPLTVKTVVFQCFLDATTSEHIARMVAMTSATDNAEKMIKSLTMAYNRARQSQITTELSEIMGGVEAMKG